MQEDGRDGFLLGGERMRLEVGRARRRKMIPAEVDQAVPITGFQSADHRPMLQPRRLAQAGVSERVETHPVDAPGLVFDGRGKRVVPARCEERGVERLVGAKGASKVSRRNGPVMPALDVFQRRDQILGRRGRNPAGRLALQHRTQFVGVVDLLSGERANLGASVGDTSHEPQSVQFRKQLANDVPLGPKRRHQIVFNEALSGMHPAEHDRFLKLSNEGAHLSGGLVQARAGSRVGQDIFVHEIYH